AGTRMTFAALRGADPTSCRHGRRARGEVLLRARRVERACEIVPLAERAVEAAEDLRLLAALDALGDDIEIERGGEAKNRVGERRVVGAVAQPVDERLRDLEDVDRKVA